MSRQSHLPPRCRFQKKPVAHPFQEKLPHHHRYPSLGSIPEDQPSWLDRDQYAKSTGLSLLRTASDPSPLLCCDDLLYADSDVGSICDQLESASVYGPNSPRQRSKTTFSENAIASALSDYVLQTPIRYVDGNLNRFGNSHSDFIDACNSVGKAAHANSANPNRHSGQRSRVRKLLYITELERAVDALQERFEYIERDQCEHTLNEEDKRFQDFIMKPDPCKDQASVLESTCQTELTCRAR